MLSNSEKYGGLAGICFIIAIIIAQYSITIAFTLLFLSVFFYFKWDEHYVDYDGSDDWWVDF